MEPSNWHMCSEYGSNGVLKSCCNKAFYLGAQNDQVKVEHLLKTMFFKIKNTEKVFEKCSQN